MHGWHKRVSTESYVIRLYMMTIPNLCITIIADFNECEADPDHAYDSICPISSDCVNTIGTYECICTNGTQMDKNRNCTGMG